MEKIKILFLHSGAELYGADQILLKIVSNLDKNKFEPIVVLPNDGPLFKKLEEQKIRTEIISYPIIRRQYFNLKGILSFIVNYYKSSKKISNFVRKEEIAIVHNNTLAVLEGIYLKKKNKIRLITHIHEMIDKPKLIAKFLYKIHLKNCDKAVVVSEAVRKHISKLLKNSYKNILTINNGIEKEDFNNKELDYYNEFGIPESSKVVAIIGRINAIKGQDHFVSAIEKITKKHDNVYGLIIGDSFSGQEWRVKKINEDIKEKGLENCIRYCGFRDDVKEIYRIIDVLVLPSIQNDSFPTVVLEAMSKGVPTVAYKCGGVEEMIKDGYNGYLVEQYDIDMLSERIEEILFNKENMEDNTKEFFHKHFTIEKFIEKFTALYKG